MAQTESRPGRGLGALIPTGSKGVGGFREIAVSSIAPNVNQPRTQFEEEPLEALADSVGRIGVLQPILVRPLDGNRFELIAGERRWRAAVRAGLETIPALVRSVEDQQSLEEALVENLQREDLNPLEEAAAFVQMQQTFGLTQQAVATRVGRSRAAVTNSTRLLQLSPQVQELIADRRLSAGHGRALLGVAAAGEQARLARRVVEEGWSVRQLENHLRPPEATVTGEEEPVGAVPDDLSADDEGDTSALASLEGLLEEYLSTSVSVDLGGRKGRLSIDFADLDDVERIYRLIVTDDS